MKEDIIDRIVLVATHIYQTNDTIRKTASIFGYSKSTIHHDVSIKLKNVDYNLYIKVKAILDKNFAEKHLRGGEATKIKYIKKKIATKVKTV